MALLIERWQRHGQHRLYVKDTETRAQLGYYDCRTGKLALKDESRSYEIVVALRPYLSGSVPAAGSAARSRSRASSSEVIAVSVSR